MFWRVPLAGVEADERAGGEGAGGEKTAKGEALSVWTCQFCPCDVEAGPTAWVVDWLAVLLVIGLVR